MLDFGLIEYPRYDRYEQRSERYLSLFDDNYKVTYNENILKLAALKQVLKGKLKHLVNDPRPYETLEAEIKTTKRELYIINYEILHEVIGKNILEEIYNRLSIVDSNNKHQVFYQDGEEKTDISHLVSSRDCILYSDEKLQILIDLFFNDKNVSIEERLKKLNIQNCNENVQKEAELELAHRTISLNKTQSKYYISRVGKTIAANYALSQVVSLGFMCAVILIALYPFIIPAFFAAIWWVPFVYFGVGTLLIAWFMNGTGRVNWDGCRDNVPNMLIDFWNMFINKTDVAYTRLQKIRLFLTFIECIICGAVSGFFVHYIIIAALILLFGSSAAIVVFAPILTIPLAIFAAANMFLFMYKFSHGTILHGVWQDIKTFLSAIFETDGEKIKALMDKLKLDYEKRYQHIYAGEKLAEKVKNKFDASILGIILNFNHKAISENGLASSIYFRTFAMLFAACICVPLIIIGIIYGQLASFHGLSAFLDGFLGVSKEFADGMSKLLCFFSGTAYISSFSYFTVKSAATSAYPKTEDESGEVASKKKVEEDPWFSQRRLANCVDNGSQTAFGFVDSKRKEQENGELEPLGNAIAGVARDPGTLAGFFVFTGAATLASYAFASAPGESVDFNKKLDSASKKYTIAYDKVINKPPLPNNPVINEVLTY